MTRPGAFARARHLGSIVLRAGVGSVLLVPLAAVSSQPAPPPPPELIDVAQVLTMPTTQDPAVALLPGGIAATRSDLLRWIEDAGGASRDFTAADAEDQTELLCAFVDDLDLGMQQLEKPPSEVPGLDRVALWRMTLIRAAYRDLVDGSGDDLTPASPDVRIARFQNIMAAIGPRPADVPADRFVADPRLDPALLRYALAGGVAARPAVEIAYRRALFRLLVRARRDAEIAEAAARFAREPTADIDTGGPAGTGARPRCRLGGQVPLTFAAARRANAQMPFLRRSVALAVRRRSYAVLVETPAGARHEHPSGEMP